MNNKKKSYPCNRPWRPIGLWDVEAPTFSRQSAHRWRWGQPYAPAALHPQEDSWYPFLLDVESTRAIVRLEGLRRLKNLMISSGIETATFRLVALCPNQLRYSVPLYMNTNWEYFPVSYSTVQSKMELPWERSRCLRILTKDDTKISKSEPMTANICSEWKLFHLQFISLPNCLISAI
jgi:hypothetical protein